MTRRPLAAFFLAVALLTAPPANALPKRLLAPLVTPCPGVVLKAGGICADAQLNLAQNAAWVKGQGFVPISSLLSISRALQETVRWSDGHLSYAASNQFAISDLGLLAWESRTNLWLQSQTFQTTWTTTNVFDATFATTTTAPDLANTAEKLTENTTNGQHLVSQSVTKAASALAYTDCLYAKAAERSRVFMLLDDGAGNGATVTIDIAGVQVGVAAAGIGTPFTSISATVAASYGGFVRACLTATSNTATTIRGQYALDSGTGTGAASNSYAGTNGQGAYIWGAQLEQASFGGPYCPSTTAVCARPNDDIRPIGALLAALRNQVAASAFVQTNPLTNPGNPALLTNSDNTINFNNRSNNSTEIYNGTNRIIATAGSGTFQTTTMKFAANWSGSGRSVVLNNGTTVTDSNGNLSSSAATFYLGNNNNSNLFVDGPIAAFAAWAGVRVLAPTQ